MRVAAAQIAPVLLDRRGTLARVVARCEEASRAGVQLIAFPEALLPGYPTWLARTGGAAFDDPLQKALHARYLDQAVELPGPELETLRELARDHRLAIVLGLAERGREAGRGTLWCTALSVRPDGSWLAHRKLVPTYEERLAWGPGDGHGLRTQEIAGWRVGVLNCWENWMPAARLALYAQGEELRVSLWPGSPGLTRDISRFTAREGRVWVLAASGVLRAADVPDDLPGRDGLIASAPDGLLHSGGSRVVGPDGREVAALETPEEGLVVAELDRGLLLAERQNFDPSGHYHRPDVFGLEVDRRRRDPVAFRDAEGATTPSV
jgi:nitrilase